MKYFQQLMVSLEQITQSKIQIPRKEMSKKHAGEKLDMLSHKEVKCVCSLSEGGVSAVQKSLL